MYEELVGFYRARSWKGFTDLTAVYIQYDYRAFIQHEIALQKGFLLLSTFKFGCNQGRLAPLYSALCRRKE